MKHGSSQLVWCWWPYFDKMIFLNLSTVTLLILASIKLLKVLWCPKPRRSSNRRFLSGGNTWKTMEIRVFKNKRKVACCHGNIHESYLVKLNFLIPRKKNHKAETPNSKPFWRYVVILVRGHNVPSGLGRVRYVGSFVLLHVSFLVCSSIIYSYFYQRGSDFWNGL